jgi:hypothetical protein
LSISSSVVTLGGKYKIQWSKSLNFGNVIVLAEGTVPGGSQDVTASFTIPESEYGLKYIQFVRLAYNEKVNVQFTVRPGLSINPSSATPGTTVTIRGTGFPANDSGSLTFDNQPTKVNISTNEMGSFKATFIVPETSPGTYKLLVNSSHLYTETVAANLEVLKKNTPEPEPPDTGDGDDISEPEDDTDNVPVNPLADTKPPPEPGIVAPMGNSIGMIGAETVTFNWYEVSDPSSVTYTLEVAENVDFVPIRPGMQISELNRNHYALNLEPGIYYWRVRAVDGAGNEGTWAYSPYAFKVGEFSILMSEFIDFIKTWLKL